MPGVSKLSAVPGASSDAWDVRPELVKEQAMNVHPTFNRLTLALALAPTFSAVSCGWPGSTPAAPATPIVMSCGHAAPSSAASPLPAATGEAGQVLLVGSTVEARRIQYVSTDIQAARVTILDASSQAIVARSTLQGESLARNLDTDGKSFAFSVLNLPLPASNRPSGRAYLARVEVFLDTDLATAIGNSTSASFSPSASRLTVVTLPALSLDATPVGHASASVDLVEAPAPAVEIR
jgi:hypothetical protein